MIRLIMAMMAAALAAASPVLPAAAEPAKVVVELFTSQGCSSCPPADAFLGELARRDDVLPLSFHVKYWNYLGWRDRFATAEATDRQRNYRRTLGKSYVYTPQMVVNGSAQAVGSGRKRVLRLIEAARSHPRLDISVDHQGGDRATVRIAAGRRLARPATVWLVFYDNRHSTKISRGENEGATLVNTNVVRVLKRVGSYSGKALELDLSLEQLGAKGHDSCAVILQQDGFGPILGAVTFPLPKG